MTSSSNLAQESKQSHNANSKTKPNRTIPNEQPRMGQMVALITLALSAWSQVSGQPSLVGPFPGVSRDLASFCAARPSLPIDLASMIVHVKKNVSFNYKLYLFSTDHVFQTGQVIPRDDFRIHSFPVKLKRLQDFWPPNVPTYKRQNGSRGSLVQVESESFNVRQFLRPVALDLQSRPRVASGRRLAQPQNPAFGPQLEAAALPGDAHFFSHDVGRVVEAREAAAAVAAASKADPLQRDSGEEENPNSHIQFDRDDQLSVSRSQLGYSVDQLEFELGSASAGSRSKSQRAEEHSPGASIVPVGSFSSFQVNFTYLVRKDFGQLEAELVRIRVDSGQFLVTQLELLGHANGHQEAPLAERQGAQIMDYDFLSHKLIRDTNTRITAINQIYEDWITRNFYTIVYIQRRLDGTNENNELTMANERLIFRETSPVLLGADQLDYSVRAAAFITEKNGLHYYLEFLNTFKFYLCAVDWTRRPFKIMDSRRFPIKATKTQLDNEELLLCPPAVCYSSQPVDEIVGYGRLPLPGETRAQPSNQRQAGASSPSVALNATTNRLGQQQTNESSLIYSRVPRELVDKLKDRRQVEAGDSGGDLVENLYEALKVGSNQLQVKLHLRDWVWQLTREVAKTNSTSPTADLTRNNSAHNLKPHKFGWKYELARRNDIKVKPDSYGYALTGHEIDASYRLFNELYLISVSDH